MKLYKATSSGNVEMSPDEVESFNATQSDATNKKLDRKISDLWYAADKYIYQYVNGVGLAILSAGVHDNQPKARACAKWSDSVWSEYYKRKEKLLNGESVSFDFSDAGPMPYDILELRQEIEHLWLP